MATILYSTEDIGDAYAPSLNAAFTQIFAESGIKPQVLAPVGGARTSAQEKALGGTDASDHVKKRAVDINNQRELRNWNQARFLAIMASFGWHNVTEQGTPFPTEPWHFANQSSTPTGGGSTPIDTDKEDEDMEIIVHVSDTSGKTTKIGQYYYVRDGVTPIVGPLTGTLTTFGQAYWINTVLAVPVKDVGGATFEAYVAELAKIVLTSSGAGTSDGFNSTDRATLNGINGHTDSAVGTVKIPTKVTGTLS